MQKSYKEKLSNNKDLKQFTDDEKKDLLEQSLGNMINATSVTTKDFRKELSEYVLEDAAEEEGITSTMISDAKEILTGYREGVKTLDTNERNQKRFVKNLQKECEDHIKAMDRLDKDKYTVANSISRARAAKCSA